LQNSTKVDYTNKMTVGEDQTMTLSGAAEINV
jgi:hypothetical protein